MTYENGEHSGPIDPLFAPEGASYRLSNDRMRYDQQAQWAMETELFPAGWDDASGVSVGGRQYP